MGIHGVPPKRGQKHLLNTYSPWTEAQKTQTFSKKASKFHPWPQSAYLKKGCFLASKTYFHRFGGQKWLFLRVYPYPALSKPKNVIFDPKSRSGFDPLGVKNRGLFWRSKNSVLGSKTPSTSFEGRGAIFGSKKRVYFWSKIDGFWKPVQKPSKTWKKRVFDISYGTSTPSFQNGTPEKPGFEGFWGPKWPFLTPSNFTLKNMIFNPVFTWIQHI